jgi:two-component system phosphate regulon sensor histidine kinase PhoR
MLAIWITFALALLLFQGFLIYTLEQSWFVSGLISLAVLFPAVYGLSKRLSDPLSEALQKLKGAGLISHRLTSHPSDDELIKLSKGVDEILSHREKKLEEMTQERNQYRAVFQGMTEGVLIVDCQGRIQMVNEALRSLLGLQADVLGRKPLEVVRHSELEEALQHAVHGGEEGALQIQLSNRKEKILAVDVVPILSPEGGPQGALAVFQDVTRLKELEKIRQDFVANVSHELRTPITTIKAYAETLLDGTLKEEVASRFVSVIKKHADRLSKIVEDLLLLSKIEARGFQFEREILPVDDLICDAFDLVKERAERKKIVLSSGKLTPRLAVEADRNHLEQVLINLLDNAIKYTPEGGTILLSVIEKEADIEFSVQDNGIGIPKEDLPRIFERFYRVDKGRSQEQGGTGLGLAIVKHIVQGHGGKVWVESEIGKGSTFYFTLPQPQKGGHSRSQA